MWAVTCNITGRGEALKLAHSVDGEPALHRQHARASGRSHPNVVAHFGLTRTSDGALAVRTERVDGLHPGALAPTLDADGRARLALDICAGLAAIHGWGLVHGDVSPTNVLVDDHGVARLLDWGVDPADGVGYATPGCAAPEILSGDPPTATADVYALGCLLHEVLSGAPLWPAGVPGPEPVLSPALRPAVASVLRSTLAWRPEARPPDAEIVLHRLTTALGADRARDALLSRALLDDGQPFACEPAQALLTGALDALREGQGAFVSLDVADDGCRARLDAWLCDEAATRGVIPLVVPNLGALGRALGTSASASRDPVHTLAVHLDAVAAERPLLVVVPAYDPDSPALSSLYETLRTASRAGPVLAVAGGVARAALRITVPRLDATDRAALLHRCSGRLHAVAGHLEMRTRGAARAVLRVALDSGVLSRSEGRWLVDRSRRLDPSDPDVARALAGQGAGRRLSDVERAVTAVLWWAPGSVPRDALHILAGRPKEAVTDALWTLVEAGLAQLAAGVSLRQHARARAAAASLSVTDAADLHRRLARWRPPGLDFADRELHRAFHELMADLSPPAERGLEVARALAARGRNTPALRLLDRLGGTAGVSVLRASVWVAEGDFDRARAILGACRPGGDQALRVQVAALLGRCGAHALALERLEGNAHSPAAQLQLARACLGTGDPRRADALAAGLTSADLPAAVRAGAFHVRSTCAWQRGAPDQAERHALDGLDATGDDRALRADLLRALGLACYYEGRHDEARRALAEATTENRALGRVPELAKCLNNLGMVDYARGQWARAVSTWDEFRVLCARTGDAVELAGACNNLGFLYARLGQIERAAVEFRRCIQLAAEAGIEPLVPVARANLGETLMHAGALTEAAEAFERAATELAAAGSKHARVELARRRAELSLRGGSPDRARVALNALLTDPGLDAEPDERGHLQRVLSACERALGRTAAAVGAASRAVAHFDAGDQAFEAAVCREALADALSAQGDPFRAAHEVALALDAYLELGARRHADRAAAAHQALVATTEVVAKDVESRRALLDVARRLGSTLELDMLAPMVLEKVVTIACAERGLFALIAEDGALEHVVAQNLEWGGPGHPLPVSQGLVERVLRTGETVTVQDVETEGDYGARRSVRLLGLRSMVGVPVRHAGQVVGLIYVDSSLRTLGDVRRDMEVLEAFAALVGACVSNARLFSEQRFRADLLAKMAHDFRAPLSVVKANAEVMRMPGTTDADVLEMMDEVRASTLRMTRMIDDTLEISRADARAEALPETVDLEDAVARHIEGLQVLAHQYEASIELRRSGVRPRLRTYPDRLWVVLDNLVFNALKFAPRGTAVTVTVRLREDPGPIGAARVGDAGRLFPRGDRLHPAPEARFVEIAVHNGGRPIPEDALPHVFEAYRRGESGSARGVKSSGLGLAIVAQCVTHLGGRVWARSERSTGTTFTFTLPQRVLDAGAVALLVG